MRPLADAGRIRRFIDALGAGSSRPARVYLTGGATAVLCGWRESTIDVDLKIVPEHDEILRAIPRLKDTLPINVELASPDLFIPVPPGWEDRSPFVMQAGPLAFHHFDFSAQALAKIERGHVQDTLDVQAMLDRDLIDPRRVLEYFASIEPELYRFPAVDPPSFRRAVEVALRGR